MSICHDMMAIRVKYTKEMNMISRLVGLNQKPKQESRPTPGGADVNAVRSASLWMQLVT